MKDIPLPKRMQGLPRDSKGRPVPQFVAKPSNGGEPDFRIVDPYALVRCYDQDLCWVCGGKLGIHKAFVLGPMCAINKVNSEPPSHYECAHYSVQVCPFLSTPRMHRREEGLQDVVEPAGIAIDRNPGVAAIWVTRTYHPFSDGRGGFLFRLGAPERVEWYCQGRTATRQEIKDSIESGFPILENMAREDGPLAVKQLEKQYNEMLKLLPAA